MVIVYTCTLCVIMGVKMGMVSIHFGALLSLQPMTCTTSISWICPCFCNNACVYTYFIGTCNGQTLLLVCCKDSSVLYRSCTCSGKFSWAQIFSRSLRKHFHGCNIFAFHCSALKKRENFPTIRYIKNTALQLIYCK